jgi:alanine-glyoxylate transaminase / serine-glyoxylate transaminase / serine-pyruvate transaminase
VAEQYHDLNVATRTLLGPGPSNVHPRVLRAMATPLIGHLDPDFLKLMAETKELLKFIFQTKNELTIPISGTGSAGMEAALCNLIEEGDEVLVAVNGVFGQRMCDIVERCRGTLYRLDVPWGEVFQPEQIEAMLRGKNIKLMAMVHAETSTGALQPVPEISGICHRYGALFLLDTVTSLGGMPVEIDAWGVDACYSGTQKCLSCPPGLSPLTYNERARDKLRNRKAKVQSWYLDLTMIEKYWGAERTYHHTAPISMNYALYEALRLVHEEGLQPRFARHKLNQLALIAGLQAMGIKMLVAEAYRLPSLSTPLVPEGVDEGKVRAHLLNQFNIEIASGLGPLKGKVWRIGLMGHSSQRENVLVLLAALESALKAQAFKVPMGAGVAAAYEVYQKA